jgi:nitroimidazol reductase NimA-like FMN-containing flavoprotein (pyridoxamine 5'-phosphate oxidase superfamily)
LVKANLKDRAREDFLARAPPKLLRLAVILDGRPHISSVWYLWSGNYFWVSTAQDRLKVRAVKKNPRVALVIDTDTMPYEGVIVEGEAVLTKQNTRRITLAIVRKYVDKKKSRSSLIH